MRLIDAEAIKLQKGFFEKVDNVPKFYEWLGTLPTVDAVEVVRCRDCKWWNGKKETCIEIGGLWRSSDFCSWGERREDETD